MPFDGGELRVGVPQFRPPDDQPAIAGLQALQACPVPPPQLILQALLAVPCSVAGIVRLPQAPPDRIEMNRQNALRGRDPSRCILVALAGAIVECLDPAPARQDIFVQSANAPGANTVERDLKERLGSIEVVSFLEVHRVEAVSQEDVQALAGKAPAPRLLRQRRPQASCGAVECHPEAVVVSSTEWAQVETTEMGAGGSDDASVARPSHARATDRDTCGAVLDGA